jgi:superfamily II DNA or RNA helicase/HKD family nuclease
LSRLIETLTEELGRDWADRYILVDPLARLLAIHGPHERAPAARPDTPLSRSALLTATKHDPTLATQLMKEIATADRVDILCSFVRWGGLRILLDALKALTEVSMEDSPRLRVITTSYMGATEARAVEELLKLPNTEVRVSYDTERTRLHAKAYIIHRRTGFGCAYIGSANISRPALTEGLKWTSKISQYELPHIWQKVIATFETHWNAQEFESLDPERLPRFRQALVQGGSKEVAQAGSGVFFDLRPYPFQEEILDALHAERVNANKKRQLVVAATGTGKTMIAAFDYKRFSGGGQPSLLFIAHREEILRQALDTFRHVMRDQNFGDLLVGGSEPEQQHHLFCSVQSYNSRDRTRLPRDFYRYVVVDEFHHAPANSYASLLDHVEPDVLLGLTATPERMDGRNVLEWFGGEATAEVRLPDAINRRLLCPFQYFGISDCVDLGQLHWERGGYRISDLEKVYTGNDARAMLVVEKLRELLSAPRNARGLGFCVSIAHAQFMARFFNEHDIASLALSADSSKEERLAARQRLVSRDVNFIFVVDLYNEGVDIPEVDTVLLLRPTESLTVYLQQLGRGLRLHDDKECLTVLDFIGAHRREFRFVDRLRSLSTEPTTNIVREVEADFPHLPAGCYIRLERVAKQRVLQNVKESLLRTRVQLVRGIREWYRHHGRPPLIREALEYLGVAFGDLLKRGLWSRLLYEAGAIVEVVAPDEHILARGIERLSHVDDPRQIRFLLEYLQEGGQAAPSASNDARRLHMFYLTLWGNVDGLDSLEEASVRLRKNASVISDLEAMLNYRLAHTRVTPSVPIAVAEPLALHASYTRDEILAGLGHTSLSNRPSFREGVLHLEEPKLDAFFVTLHKTEGAYSPTTMYEDYAISERLFHWQSQNTTSIESPTGRRYIMHREEGYTPLLFVREHKRLPSGLAAPYVFRRSFTFERPCLETVGAV